jgi:ABC-2 type transport system permease protein
MNFRIISALVLRYLFLYTRTPMRLIELIFWPLVDLMVWGNLTLFLKDNTSESFGGFLMFLIGGMILWDVLFRAQQGVAISFLEDVWTRNLLNVFVAPVRTTEYVAATFSIGFGTTWVWGRSRVPLPASGMITFMAAECWVY